MLAVSGVRKANTLETNIIKGFLSYIRVQFVLHTVERSRSDQIKYIVSQVIEVHARCERNESVSQSVSRPNTINMKFW